MWVIVGTPAKRHLNGVSLAGQGWPTYSSICILSSTKFKERERERERERGGGNVIKVVPPLAKPSVSAHAFVSNLHRLGVAYVC